ncbi:hypothetical protein EJB05_49181, partial [Eragrostis curvula]
MDSETPLYDAIPEFRYRLIDLTGVGFVLGAGGGSAFHFIRGLRGSPGGARLVSGLRAVGTYGPRVAGRWGAYLAVLGALETSMTLARRREESEDPWNSIAAAAATGGLFGMRRGAPAAARSALVGATLIAGLMGASWAIDIHEARAPAPATRPCWTSTRQPVAVAQRVLE